MDTLYNLKHKGKITIVLLLFVFFEIFKSTLYKNNMSEIENSFSEVYSDRVLAQNYIFQLTDKVYQCKQLLVNNFQTSELIKVKHEIHAINAGMKQLMGEFEKTKLTNDEKAVFVEFKKQIAGLEKLEYGLSKGSNNETQMKMLTVYNTTLNSSLNKLHTLSDIQISEAKLLHESSQKIADKSAVLGHFELGLIIAIAICIQILIFNAKSVIPKQTQDPFLN